MKKISLFTLLFCLVCSFNVFSSGQPVTKTNSIRFTVVDSNNIPVSNVSISLIQVIMSNITGPPIVTFYNTTNTTDEIGKTTFQIRSIIRSSLAVVDVVAHDYNYNSRLRLQIPNSGENDVKITLPAK